MKTVNYKSLPEQNFEYMKFVDVFTECIGFNFLSYDLIFFYLTKIQKPLFSLPFLSLTQSQNKKKRAEVRNRRGTLVTIMRCYANLPSVSFRTL